jgi:hypothetical protein
LPAKLPQRHCERSEAIHLSAQRKNGLLRSARNDGCSGNESFHQRRPGESRDPYAAASMITGGESGLVEASRGAGFMKADPSTYR